MTISARPSVPAAIVPSLAATIVPLGQHDDIKLSGISPQRWWGILSEMGLHAAPTTPASTAEEGLEFKVIATHLPTSEDLRHLIEAIHTLGNRRGRDLLCDWLHAAGLDPWINHPHAEDQDQETVSEFVARIWLLARDVPAAKEALNQAQLRAEIRLDLFCRSYPAINPSAVPVSWDATRHKAAIEEGVRSMMVSDKIIPFVDCTAVVEKDGSIILKITHGEPTRSLAYITPSSTRGVFRFQRARSDVLRYSPQMDELTIRCNRAPLIRGYLALIGRVFYGKVDYFSSTPVTNLSKLLNEEAVNQASKNIPSLRRVVVTKLRLREDDAGGADTFEHPDGVLPKIRRKYHQSSVTVLKAELTFHFFNGLRRDSRIVVKLLRSTGPQYKAESVHQPAVQAFIEGLGLLELPGSPHLPKDWTVSPTWIMTTHRWSRMTGGKSIAEFERAGLLVRMDRTAIEDARMGLVETVEVAGRHLTAPTDPVTEPWVVAPTDLDVLRCDMIRQAHVIGEALGTTGDIGTSLLDGRVIDLGSREVAGNQGYHAFLILRPVSPADLAVLRGHDRRLRAVGLVPPVPRDDQDAAPIPLVRVTLPSIICDGLTAEILHAVGMTDLVEAVDLAPAGTDLTLDEATRHVWWQPNRTLISLREAEFSFLLQLAKSYPHHATHEQLQAAAGPTASKRKGPLSDALIQVAGPDRGELISPRSGKGYILNCVPYVKAAVSS